MALVSPDASRVIGEHLERVLEQRLSERQTSTTISPSSHSNNISWDWYAPVDDCAEWEVRMGQLRRAPWMSDAFVQRDSDIHHGDQSSARTIPFQANMSASQFCHLASHLQCGFGGWVAESNWYREEDVFYDVKPLISQSSIDNAGLTPSSPYFAATARERVRKRTSQGVEWCIAKEALQIHPPSSASSSSSSSFQLNTPLLAYLGVPASRIPPWTTIHSTSPRHVIVQGSSGSDERILTNNQARLEEVDDVFDAIQKQSLMTCTCASFANNNNNITNIPGEEATTTSSQQQQVGASLAERALVMACVRQQCADATWFNAPSTQDAIAWTQWFGGAVPDIRLELSMERAIRVHLGRTDAALPPPSLPPLAKSTGRAKSTTAASKRAPSKRTQAAMATLQPFLEGGADRMETSNNLQQQQQQQQPIHLNYGNAAYVAASIKSGNSSNTVTHKHRVEALARIKIRKSWILGMMPLCSQDETCIASHFEMCKRPCWRFDLTMSWSAKNRVAAEEMFCAHLLQQQHQQQDDSSPINGDTLSTHVPPSHAQTSKWLTRMAACAAQLEVEVECIDPLYHGVWLQYAHNSLNATTTATTPPLPIGEMLLNQLLQHVVNLCGTSNPTVEDLMSNTSVDIDTVSPALFSPVLLQTTPLS